MDNITHTLIGVGLAKAGLSQRYGRGTTLLLAIASNIPDIDVAVLFSSNPLAFLWRRTPTHSVLGASIIAVLLAAFFRWIYPNLSWRAVIGLSVLGIVGHVFADLWNSYGVVMFWPFSWRRVDLSWVFIIDLAIWGILVVSLIAGLVARAHQEAIWRVGLSVLAVYLGVCASARQLAHATLTEQATRDGLAPAAMYFYPEPFGPQRFRGVVQEPGRYSVYLIRPFQKKAELLEKIDATSPEPFVAAARASDAGRKLDSFFSTPVWRAASDGQAGEVYGLGFRSKVLDRRRPFYFRVTPEGQVEKS
jgi:membrane-bound metal-dependent hydrolase YbcI (DUF457 family)